MNKKISLGLAVSLIAIASAVTFILTSFFSLQSYNEKGINVNEQAKKYSSLQSIDSYVRENYYGNIDESKLNDGILKGYLSGLGDKYSRYLTADEYISEQNDNNGELVGLGLTLTKDESGYIKIVEIAENSPVSEGGLIAGDIITAVDGVDVLSAGFDKSVDSMKGTEGSNITLTVRRDAVDKDYTFTRSQIEITSVTGEMRDNYIGYIKISGFKANTPEQFMEVIERLTLNGAKGLVFDLRDNPGGLATALQSCLDPLLPEGIIAVAEYKDGHTETMVYSDESELNLPMAVLVNKNTASAGELFSASLHDFGKAKLIGEKTYGKGVMQDITEFENGGAVVLTVAEYRTTVSECYNGVGITPDYSVDDDSTTENDEQYDKAVEVVLSEMK